MVNRVERLLPAGVPRHIRIYDDGGKSGDRYTVVYTGKAGQKSYVGMNAYPFHPQGICQHGESNGPWPIDRPRYSHLGKKISFAKLPADCQTVVMRDYAGLYSFCRVCKYDYSRIKPNPDNCPKCLSRLW